MEAANPKVVKEVIEEEIVHEDNEWGKIFFFNDLPNNVRLSLCVVV